MKTKDSPRSLDFSNLHPQKNETKQLHVTKNKGDLPVSVISLLCNSAPHLADLGIAANRRKTKDRPRSFHFCHFGITKKQQNGVFFVTEICLDSLLNHPKSAISVTAGSPAQTPCRFFCKSAPNLNQM